MRHLDARALAALAARAAAAGRTAGASTATPVLLLERSPLPFASSRPLSTIAHPSPAKRTTSLLPALESWRRALHALPAGQARGLAAAAAAHPATVDESDEEADEAATHARRLRELQQHQHQQPQQRRRQLDLSQVPMLDIKGAGGCSSSSSSPSAAASTSPSAPVRAAPPPLDWREVVRRARAHEQQHQDPLTDLHGRTHDYLRISLTERCNLRCSYCMPEEGVALTPSSHLLTPTEVQRLARLFVRAGVTKIRLTGGEPTVRRDLVEVVARLAELQGEGLRSIALTSNGVALERQLPRLRAAGLTHLNVSLDTLSPQRFERLTRRPADAHARVLGALDAALELGFGGAIGGAGATAANNNALPFSSAPFSGSSSSLSSSSFASTSAAAPAGVKLNVVVVRGVNDDEVELFSALTRSAPLNVRFIEYMPFDGNAWGKGKGMVPYAELRGRADLYAARTAAEEQAAAMAAAALPFPLPMAPAWPLAGGGGGGLGLSPSSSSPARGGVMSFAAAAYHRLAGGDAFWEKEQRQQERRRRPLGPIARFAAEAGAALPLAPPPPAQQRPFTADGPLLALRRLDDHPSEVAKNFRAPGHAGTLSFVTSMTSHFCGGCSRLRLLADGALKVCLFGASEVSLRDAARGGATDGDLLAVVGAAVRRKKASHAGMHEIARTSNRPMITIGG
jgi:molybdenum cofactor biosynthesis enzyme MoaA